jgi:hypothetical protein
MPEDINNTSLRDFLRLHRAGKLKPQLEAMGAGPTVLQFMLKEEVGENFQEERLDFLIRNRGAIYSPLLRQALADEKPTVRISG